MTEEPVRVASAAAAPAIARAQEHHSHTHLVFPNLLDTFRSLLSIIVIALFVLTFVVQPFRIPSESMERTLLVGDFLLVNKTVYGTPGGWHWLLPYEQVTRGDVVSKIWAYIKKNNLQNPANKREILADAKLKPVFDGKDKVSMFEMNKNLAKHLTK